MAIDEPFEYLSFGGTFSRTFSILIDRFEVFMALSVVVLVPTFVLNITVGLIILYWMIEEDEIPDFEPHHIPLVLMILFIQMVLYTLVTIIGRGAMIRAVGLMYIGQHPTWLDCLKVAWEKKWALLGTSAILCGVFLLACLAPLIFSLLAVGAADIKPLFILFIFLASVTGIAFIFGGFYGGLGVLMTFPAILRITMLPLLHALLHVVLE
jgi:hypothetical protein